MVRAADFEAQVADAMADIVAGNNDGLWALHALAAPSIGRMLQREARRLNAWLGADDLHGLTVDAVLVLAGSARSWKPGAALPWVWGKRKVLALVSAHLGQLTRELDDEVVAREAPPVAPAVDDPGLVLHQLAQHHDGAAQLERHLATVASERDADIWLRFQLERAAGNRSPAVTVGVDHDLQPATVRKTVQRVGERLALAAA